MHKRTAAYREHIRERLDEVEIDRDANTDNEFLKMIEGKEYTSQRVRSLKPTRLPDHLINTKQQKAIIHKEN